MSSLNNDKLVLEKGRKPLKDITAPLRDQITKKLFDKLNDMNVGASVVSAWESETANYIEWFERQKTFLADIDDFSSSTAEGPFQGSSSLHIPVTLTACKTVHARFLQALLGMDPPFTTKARTEGVIERAQVVQDVMRYNLMEWANHYDGISREVDAYLWRWITSGVGLMKIRWECEYEKFIDVQMVQEAAAPHHGAFAGEEFTVPQTRMREVEKEVVQKTFEGQEWEAIEAEDVRIIGGGGNIKKADEVQHGTWLSASQLWTLVDRKIFDKDAVTAIIEGGPDLMTGMTGSDIKNQRALNAGQTRVDTDNDLDRYHIIESYRSMDVDGSGINSKVVVWVHKKSKKLLHANYLRRLNKTGEIPIEKTDFMLRPGQTYGYGLCEMLHPLSVEMDAVHNQRIDFGTISIMPFGFYRPSSNLNPETLSLEPGSLIPVDNPQTDVYFPNLGNRTAFGFQEEQAIYTYIERLISVNDMSLGVMSGSQGATRTATGARALLGESNSNLDVYVRRLHRSWRRLLRISLHMLQQRIPAGLSFRITGEGGDDYWRTIREAADIEGDYDFEISPNSADSNPQIMQERAQQIYSLVLNPLLIQTGVVNQGNIYEAAKNVMRSQGIKDFGRYITQPQGWTVQLMPIEELNRVLRGVDVPVVPQMDHQGFLDLFAHIQQTPELFGQYNEQQVHALAAQAQKHQQMLQALQQQAAQTQNAQQMRLNAVQSGAQAPPAQNPFAGGQPPA